MNTNTRHLEILTEELSMEEFLRNLLPRLLPDNATFNIYSYQGKSDLLKKLPDRLRGYSSWLPGDWRVVVIIDRDDDNCRDLKSAMESAAKQAPLRTRTATGESNWQLVNRIAIEELEAWYFGDWAAVCQAYPRVPNTIPNKERYRNPDHIPGGAWEAFEQILQRAGYYPAGLAKLEAARRLGALIDPMRNRSTSFGVFRDAINEAVTIAPC